MDSKVQKAVYSVVDQLLTKIEDRCDVEKAKLWDLWRTMFNFPEAAKPRVKKTSPKKPLISPDASPVSRAPAPVSPPKIEKPVTPPAPVSRAPAPVSPPKIEKPATPPAPVAVAPVDQSEQKVDSPVAPVEESVVAPVEEVRVVEQPVVEEKAEPVAKKLEIEDDDEDDIPIVKTAKKEVNSPKREENPNNKTECCYIMTRGPRKGQMCGDVVQKKNLAIRMCTFHAKKA